jgi:hypothetical protein
MNSTNWAVRRRSLAAVLTSAEREFIYMAKELHLLRVVGSHNAAWEKETTGQ